MLPEAVNVLMLVVEAFDRLHIPYLIGGSMASALHGVTRSTIDADLIAEIKPEQAHAVVQMLGEDFYVDQAQFQRREEQLFSVDPDQKAFVATAEDTILAKLEWYRLGGEISDRQWRDILGVIKVQEGQLELAYLQKWAVELGVADLLQKALNESE